jgi:antitoxin component YwqK of YwqJK toxin-antitoxin module
MFHSKKTFAALALLLLPMLSLAQEGTLVYKAKLSEKDHFNSSGQRLNKAMAILRQDRANFHTFNIKDVEDESDEMFKNKEVRADMEKMVVSISKATEKAILNGTPVIQMEVFGDGGAEITLVTDNQAINKTIVPEKKAVSENNNHNDIATVEEKVITSSVTRGGLTYELNQTTPFTGMEVNVRPDGTRRTAHYVDGKENGLRTFWYANGQKKEESNYVDDKLNGLYIRWFENGQKEAEANYVDDRLNGSYISWSKNGQKATEGNYVNGSYIPSK